MIVPRNLKFEVFKLSHSIIIKLFKIFRLMVFKGSHLIDLIFLLKKVLSVFLSEQTHISQQTFEK